MIGGRARLNSFADCVQVGGVYYKVCATERKKNWGRGDAQWALIALKVCFLYFNLTGFFWNGRDRLTYMYYESIVKMKLVERWEVEI